MILADAAASRLAHPQIDAIGRWLLHFADKVYISFTVIAVVAILSISKRIRYGDWPTVIEAVRTVAAMLFIASGLMSMIIFSMTSPPAVGELSETDLAWIGLLTGIVAVGLGLQDIRESFFKRSNL